MEKRGPADPVLDVWPPDSADCLPALALCMQASFTFIAFLTPAPQEGAFQSGAVKVLTFYHSGGSGRA